MKKSKWIVMTLLVLAVVVGAVSILNACGEGGDNLFTNAPTASDWQDIGLGSSFDVQVNGSLVNNVVEDGEIYMKWQNSDEGSLDKTVDWLKSNGYTSMGGVNSTVEVLENGIISYTAEKENEDGELIVVEVIYVSRDFSVAGQSFKAGELYFNATPVPSQGGGNGGNGGNGSGHEGVSAVWPSDDIQDAIGISIPEYVGNASTYMLDDAGVEITGDMAIYVFDADQNHNYASALTSGGFALDEDGYYVKQLSNGDSVAIEFYMTSMTNPVTYYQEDTLVIVVSYNKNSGTYTSWSQLDLSQFSSAGLVAYSGGTSFDIVNVQEDYVEQQRVQLDSAISALEIYGEYLNEEQKAMLASLKEKVECLDDVRAVAITVYGTDDDEQDEYATALDNTGFVDGEKDVADFRYNVSFSGYVENGKFIITITKMPMKLFEDIGGGSSDGGNGGGVVDEPLYTMPENLKVEYSVSNIEYTAIKVGDDYYQSYGYYGYYLCVYYKKNGNVWDVYEKDMGATEWVKSDYQEDSADYIEGVVFDFMVDAYVNDDAVNMGTQTIEGRQVTVYRDEYSGVVDTYYQDNETGLMLKKTFESGAGNYEYVITLYDDSITSFEGINLPQ